MMTYFDMSQLSRGALAIGRMVQEREERVAALEHALDTALARAEAAEARVAELEAILASDEADENQWFDAYTESAAKDAVTIKRLMARVAELEAALAAQQWRPISTDPDEPGMYVIMDRERTYAQVWWWIEATYEYEPGDEYKELPCLIPAYWNASPDGYGDCLELDGADADAAYWQRVLPPLPLPPDATEATEEPTP